MIITCKKCNTNYITPASSITGTGRKVQCIKCEYIWHATPTTITNLIELNFDITDPNCEEFKSMREQLCTKSCKAKFTICLLLSMIILTILIFYKNNVTTIFPALNSLYEQSWLFSTDQLALNNFRLEQRSGNLWLTGNITNQSSITKHFPKIRITICDQDDNPIITHQLHSQKPELVAGEVYQLHNKIINLAENADHITVDLGNDLELLIKDVAGR